MALALLIALAGCGTNPPIGPTPGGVTDPADPLATAPSTAALTVNINIDSSTVSPSNAKTSIVQGRSVILVTKTDHDVTLMAEGAGVDQKVFVGRLTTNVTTFVVEQSGTVRITSSSPAATIIDLTVS